jgi:hypothetical protein
VQPPPHPPTPACPGLQFPTSALPGNFLILNFSTRLAIHHLRTIVHHTFSNTACLSRLSSHHKLPTPAYLTKNAVHPGICSSPLSPQTLSSSDHTNSLASPHTTPHFARSPPTLQPVITQSTSTPICTLPTPGPAAGLVHASRPSFIQALSGCFTPR